ncbi:hypothetical protein C1336_000080042 [Campylobacter jejuni subsp. jejuni 1336]|nr:hypothetical protein C1336_000080042 [Campylobacter jejuni subsp. jejuni 1336]
MPHLKIEFFSFFLLNFKKSNGSLKKLGNILETFFILHFP